jgi:spore coat polysaccharide biosynthesis predicted glycosyltransferase SpsG
MGEKIFIVTEGGRGMGYGHLMRCISLGQALSDKGVEPFFIVNGDETVKKLLREVDHIHLDWITKSEELFSRIKGAAVAVIDSYFTSCEFLKRFAASAEHAVYIDDNRRLDYPKGMVINGNIFAQDLGYPEQENVSYMLGTSFTLLRRPFWYVEKKAIPDKISRIMVTLGGNDIRGLTPSILGALKNQFPDLVKEVIIGGSFNNRKDLEKMGDAKTLFVYEPDAAGMKEVMMRSDVAITAGGQTIYELARTGVSPIGVCVVDNQKRNVKAWSSANLIEYAGEWDSPSLLDGIMSGVRALSGRGIREKRMIIGRGLVDGLGSLRIAEKVLKYA